MEHARLRPVPSRTAGPLDAAEALSHVSKRLPQLDEQARRALALVELVGRSRADAGLELELGGESLAETLARGRKALRRSLFPLSASGWCERAERLISDRLDGELEPPGPARLNAHLGHCERCVEHEQRLESARTALVESFGRGEDEDDEGAQAAVAAKAALQRELRVVEKRGEADEGHEVAVSEDERETAGGAGGAEQPQEPEAPAPQRPAQEPEAPTPEPAGPVQRPVTPAAKPAAPIHRAPRPTRSPPRPRPRPARGPAPGPPRTGSVAPRRRGVRCPGPARSRATLVSALFALSLLLPVTLVLVLVLALTGAF